MGDAVTADVTDFTATWYNPAMLVTRKDLNFGLGFNWQRATTTVQATDPLKTVDCTHCSPDDTVGYTAGILFPLGGKVKNRVAIGVGLYLPQVRLLRTEAPDPQRPFWYMFTGSPERIVVVAGLGIRLTDNLTIGIGAQSLADLVGSGAHVAVDLFSKDVTFRELDSHLSARTAPVAGIFFQPVPEFRLGFDYRWEMYLNLVIPASIDLTGIGELDFVVSALTHYSPHTFNLGAAWDVMPDLTFTLDGSYQLWHLAPSPYLSLDEQLTGPILTSLGLANAFTMSSPKVSPGFSDTFTVKAGMEYRVSDRFAARGGAFYRPTPVPRQDAPQTNILDASTLGFSAGAGVAFDDPLEIFQAPIKVDIAAQAGILFQRHAEKDPTDTVPSYNYSAWTFGLTGAVRYDF